jgi:hypothetical protein
MMWTCETQSLSTQTRRYSPRRDGRVVSYGEIVRLWQVDEAFRAFFVKLLANCPLAGFRLETPAVSRSTASGAFEFVLIDTPSLPRAGDAGAFAKHFAADAPAVAFANLGRDATLVVPCPRGPADHYAHLATFVRNAPAAQVDAFWRLAGVTVEAALGERPVWVSTAGLGVSWLHLRIDERPKYYAHASYRSLQ